MNTPPLSDPSGASVGYDISNNGIFMPILNTERIMVKTMTDPINNVFPFYYMYATPLFTSFHAYCPSADAKFLIRFALERNLSITGLASPCGSQSSSGYIRCICIY